MRYLFLSSNLLRLRDFIKHVYIDQKYAGAMGNDKLSMVKEVSLFLMTVDIEPLLPHKQL